MRSNAWMRVLPLAVVSLVMLATHPGWRITDLTNVLDPSWEAVLNKAWAEQWQFGSDIVFTFGPYGFLFTEFIPTFALRLAITSFMALLFIASLFRLLSEAITRPLVVSLIALVIWDSVKSEYVDSWYQTLAILPCLLVWTVSRTEAAANASRTTLFDRALIHSLMPALAVMSLAKLNLAAISVISVGAIVLDALARRRPASLLPVLTFSLSCFALWLLAGQSIVNIPAWVRGSLEIISGYDSMSRGDATKMQLVVMVAAMVGLTATLGFVFWNRHRFWSVVPTAAIAGFLLVSFKSSIVRFDHVVIVRSVLASLGVLAAVLAFGVRSERWGRKIAIPVGLLGLMLTVAASSYSRSESWRVFPGRYSGTFWNPRAQFEPMVTVLRERGALDARWERNLARLREENPIPPIEGTVDIFGHDQALAIAYNWNYLPRPVIQSYSAYTPYLLELNRDFLGGSGAPDKILFSLDTIDQRYRSLDDGLSWLDLLTHYEAAKIDKEHLLLSRLRERRSLELTLIETHDLGVGETIELPTVDDGDAVWAQVEMELSPFGKLKKNLYKTHEMKIEVVTSDGTKQTHRFVPGSGKAGFLLSPYVTTTDEFRTLFASGTEAVIRPASVRTVRFFEDSGSSRACYQARMTVRFSRISVRKSEP